MQWRNKAARYGLISRSLHWLIAALVLFMLCLGWSLDLIPKAWKPLALSTHKSLGISILLLALLRLAWRLYNAPPPLTDALSGFEKKAAHAMHWLLYALLLAMPITGWAMTSAFGKPPTLFGLFTLPSLTAADRPLGEMLSDVHSTLACLLAGCIALHAAAALWHHFIRKDNMLKRMLP